MYKSLQEGRKDTYEFFLSLLYPPEQTEWFKYERLCFGTRTELEMVEASDNGPLFTTMRVNSSRFNQSTNLNNIQDKISKKSNNNGSNNNNKADDRDERSRSRDRNSSKKKKKQLNRERGDNDRDKYRPATERRERSRSRDRGI